MESFYESEFMLSDSVHFVLLTLILALVFHLPIWCGRNFCKRKWKYVDYLWPIIAGVGMLGAVSEIRSSVADNWAQTEQTRAVTILEAIQDYSVQQIKSEFCSGLIPATEQQTYNEACRWYLSVAKYLKFLEFKQLPKISHNQLFASAPNSDWAKDDVVWVQGMVDEYQKQKTQYEQTKLAQIKHPLERIFWYVSPYLICFAVALRLTKVTGELRLENR
ncbi:hypothetical protein [Vibrio sagamiensis]|nr:hypothetical protein [Vibrio sagamiensis]PNQ63040.1 hypothetical protein C1141_10355 [Vibrio agarivorans]